MVSLFRYKYNYRSFLLFLCALIISFKSFGIEITTGNLLPNSGNGQDWNSNSTDIINSGSSGYVSNGSTMDGFTVTCDEGQANCGYKHDTGGDFEVTGTAKLSVNDIALTNNSINQSMLDSGVTLNSKIDVANCDSVPGNCEGKKGSADSHTTTVQLKDSNGNVLSTSSQTRNNPDGFQGNCNGYPGSSSAGISENCGQYTDTITFTGTGSNKVDWAWSGTDGNSTTSSRGGPNLLGSSLTMTYTDTNYTPINEGTQDVIDDIDQDIVDIIEDLPEDFDWNTDEYVWEDEYTFKEEEYTWEDEYVVEDDFYFEEEYTMEEDMYFEEFEMEEFDITEFEQPPMFEDFEDMPEMDFEEMPSIEEVFFEDDYVMEPPPMMMEEVFTEEFEEDFTDFLEETGMEEEFMEFLEEEGITAEEFFEEITEEEFNDEQLTEESFEEFEEEMVEGPINEESPPEIIEETKEAPEETDVASEPIEEEKEVASNEPTKEESPTEEDKPSSEDTEESEVQPEDSEEQDSVQPEGTDEVDTDNRITTDVAKIESKLKQNLKKIAKQIAQVTKENTQNLTKEDLFFKGNDLDAYKQVAFYTAKGVYENTNMGLFLQIDLSPYTGDIYVGANLNAYKEDDPIEINRVKLINITTVKNKLLAELEALRR